MFINKSKLNYLPAVTFNSNFLSTNNLISLTPRHAFVSFQVPIKFPAILCKSEPFYDAFTILK